MGASTAEGTEAGHGAADGNKGPGNNRTQYSALNGPHIVASGITLTTGWKTTVTLPKALPSACGQYVVMLMQSDITNSDGRGSYPPHVEKLDANGNNEDDGFDSNMGGFVLHNGDGGDRTFMWLIAQIGFNY